MNWNQPCCEACWLDPDRPDSRAAVTDGRLHAPIPARLTDHDRIEQCAYCGRPTIVGIYVRAHPDTVPHPAPDN